MPLDHIQLAKKKLSEYGVNETDVEVIEVPEGVPEGCVMVTMWPHYLSVARVDACALVQSMRPRCLIFNYDPKH